MADGAGYTLICEADLVPCRGIGDFEVFWPLENERAWGYVYQGRLLRGHTSPLVCYVINKTAAAFMLTYFERESKGYDLRT